MGEMDPITMQKSGTLIGRAIDVTLTVHVSVTPGNEAVKFVSLHMEVSSGLFLLYTSGGNSQDHVVTCSHVAERGSNCWK